MVTDTVVIHALKTMCIDILASPRWQDPNTPLPNHLVELVERPNIGRHYAVLKADSSFQLLFEIMETYELALNDDWMPFDILGLDLPLAKDFIESILEILETQEPSGFENAIRKAYKRLAQKNKQV